MSYFLQQLLIILEGTESFTIPSPPGTVPIKPGYVRLYHQTTEENLKKIEKEGLLLKHAKGIEGPRAIYTTKTPFYGDASNRPTLEFQLPQNEFYVQFALRDVMPDDFIAVHYPWHRHARYIEDNPRVLKETLAGENDHLLNSLEYGSAIKYIKFKYL